MNAHRLLLVVCLCSVTAFAQTRANLVPNPEFRVDTAGKPLSWQFWSPRPDLRPRAASQMTPMVPCYGLRLLIFPRSENGCQRVSRLPLAISTDSRCYPNRKAFSTSAAAWE